MKLFKSLALAAILAAGLSSQVSAHGYELGELEIGHPWSRETPDGARVAAGYATITNKGAEADRLVEVRSDISASVEIHEMAIDDNGVMTMRPLADGLDVPAGAEVKLEPGSFHIMFINPDASFKEGERFNGTLVFESAGEIDVEFAVEAMGGAADTHDHSGH